MNTFDDVCNYVKALLMDSSAWGGPWFKTEEEFENWAGDIFYEVVENTLRTVGVTVDDDGNLVEAWRKGDGEEEEESDEEEEDPNFYEEEPDFNFYMGFDPYMGCYSDDC